MTVDDFFFGLFGVFLLSVVFGYVWFVIWMICLGTILLRKLKEEF